MTPRLVITGMGAITPIGSGVDTYWQNLIAGKCGIGPITRFDASRLPARIAGEVRGFDDANPLPRPIARAASLFMRFAFVAADEALAQARLDSAYDPARIGICMSTALGGAEELAQGGAEFAQSSTGRISPQLVPRSIPNMGAAHLAISHGFHGPGLTICTACSAGGDAMMTAAMLLLSGEADAVLVVAGESALTPAVVSSLSQARALSRRNDDPKSASRPFENNRDGFVIGEGGGAIVLEKEDGAKARGANILAHLAGWANTMDAYHITAPNPEGEGAAACMKLALRRANFTSSDIGYINAHGTATRLGDIAETTAIKTIFGAYAPPVSSTKGATGHLMGAGALTELIACVMALREGILPPTLNLEEPDPVCDLDYVPNMARKHSIRAAMSNSLGFGGQNSSIIITL